jgi:hypothetical protein
MARQNGRVNGNGIWSAKTLKRLADDKRPPSRAKLAPGTQIEVWCQGEMRVGQQYRLTYRWHDPALAHDIRIHSTYPFGLHVRWYNWAFSGWKPSSRRARAQNPASVVDPRPRGDVDLTAAARRQASERKKLNEGPSRFRAFRDLSQVREPTARPAGLFLHGRGRRLARIRGKAPTRGAPRPFLG